jgi:hypothetical protein
VAVIKVPDVFDLGLIALLYPFELPLEILLAFSLVLLQYFLRELALVLVLLYHGFYALLARYLQVAELPLKFALFPSRQFPQLSKSHIF